MAVEKLLTVQNIAVEYKNRTGAGSRRIIDDVSFEIGVGETLALVGESGSGKSTIGKAVLGLTPIESGAVHFLGKEISSMTRRQRRVMAGQIQAVFQNPYGSLNPALTVGQILAEPLLVKGRMSRADIEARISQLLKSVHLPVDAISRYPGSFSGGQRQRIAIARAIALEPALVVCDEPTSALDVTTQASVLRLLKELQHRMNSAFLFITHDLAVVRDFASRVIVLRDGRIVETGTAQEICENPKNQYTQELVASAPVPDPILQRERRLARVRRVQEVNDRRNDMAFSPPEGL